MLGFATIGLWLFYMAYRYNLLFVNSANVDTKGLVYPKALQHTLVGCYISIICLIGLFGIRAAPGPIVLMVVFLIFCILYHVSLNAAITPLLYYLPRSLDAEEDSLLEAQEGIMSRHHQSGNGYEKDGTQQYGGRTTDDIKPLPPAPHQKPSLFAKFLRPDLYTDYATLRRLVPRDFAEIRYDEHIEREAYYHPAVVDRTPLLWVPRDQAGVSRQECAHTSRVTPMTDEGAYFNEKGKMAWDLEGTQGRPPIYDAKIYY